MLADRLAELSGFESVFFCNSGAEANEAAIKLARKFAYRRGETARNVIVAADGSFHGFMGYDRRWLDAPHIGDHVGRTVWAPGETTSTA